MAEIVSSAVASEAVSRISSFVLGDRTSHECVEGKAERLEMAVLKIRSVVAVSEDLHITHRPLLHWKAKLKRVAKEGDNILHAHKKQILECRRGSNSTVSTSITQYFIQAAKRFVPFGRKDEDLGDTVVQRFERFADGADSFFKLVESGGHPKGLMLLPSLTRSLLAGNSMEFSLQRGGGTALILLWPWLDPQVGNGSVGCFIVSYENEVVWEKSLKMAILFRLTEAADIFEIAMGCLELLPPQFSAACLAIRGLVAETIAQRTDYFNLSTKSVWCCQRIQSYHLSDCVQSTDNGHTDPALYRVMAILLSWFAMCLPSYLLPEMHCNRYELVEPSVMEELLPEVTDGFYYEEKRAPEYKRQMWCSQKSTYMSVAPVISQPLTMSQAYVMANPGAASTSRRRTQRTHSHSRLRTQ